MNLHANHRTCPSSRRLICRRVLEDGWTLERAAAAAGCSTRTACKWVRRFREGDHQLLDRSSRPRRCPTRLAHESVLAIQRLRRLRMTAAEIAEVLGLPLSTVSLWLQRIGLGTRSRLEPPEPPNRYERRHAGELVHVDIKKLACISTRGAGHRVTGQRGSKYVLRAGGRRFAVTGYEYVHVNDRRSLPARLRRSAGRPHRPERDRLPASGRRLVLRARSAHPARDDR